MPKSHHRSLPVPKLPGLLCGVAVTLATLPAAAWADDEQVKGWTFGGFGTVGISHTTEKLADYGASPISSGVVGASRAWSYDVDSRLGAQLSYTGKQWSAVVQVVSERGLKNSYTPIVEWANIKYQVTPDLSLRVGRIALPLFLSSDYRKASYALPWVRTPVELYGALPISNSDGVDASYRWTVGHFKNVTQVLYGSTVLDTSDTTKAHAHGLAGFSNTTTIGDLSVRTTAIKGDMEMDFYRPVFDGFRQFGPAGEALARRYETRAKRATVLSAGFNYDPGNWFLMGEIGRVNARSFLGDKTAAYLSAGYRYENLTPYLTYSKVVANTPIHADGLALDGLPPFAAATAQQLNQALNAMLAGISVQDTASLGLRWDVGSSTALKFQYDHVRPRHGSNGTFYTPRPGYRPDHAAGVFSATLDFVF
jgi:hypothetical protein